jgi:chromosome segregation ATPase
MNTNDNLCNLTLSDEIKINSIKLSLEKLENLQRISLTKKINNQKEYLNYTKREKNLYSELDDLNKNNNELKNKIEITKENIKQLNQKNIIIKNQAEKLDEKILSLETENSKNFSEVKNNLNKQTNKFKKLILIIFIYIYIFKYINL